MTAATVALSRTATGGPRPREGIDRWAGLQEILAACPFVLVPSPVREALARLPGVRKTPSPR